MTPEIDAKFSELESQYGEDSICRVKEMLDPRTNVRDALQSGAKYILPGLSTKPWLDSRQFPELVPIVERLEQQSSLIKQEINEAISGQSHLISPYGHYLGTQESWDALYLFQNGSPVEASAQVVPVTWEIFQNEVTSQLCPLLEMHFSILKPGGTIAPHCDLWNFSVNLHLAVDIPPGCKLIVANEGRDWEEGKCLLFDYSYIHEAYNHSDKNRICLLMDLWHPDVTQPEREALSFIIAEIRRLME